MGTSAARDRISIAGDAGVAAGPFAFATAPFEAGPDPRFVYSHTGLQRVCAELLAFDLSERPGLLLITGAAGTGKSTLLQSILDDRRLGEHSHAFSCAGGLSFEALVEEWCAALGLTGEAGTPETRRSALTAHLAARGKKAGTPALLLDDAEALDDRALEELCDLAGVGTEDRRVVRIVLSGRPQLSARLARPDLAALGQAIAFRTRLEAMNEAEVEGYIRHRLAVAGHEAPDELFSAQALEIVARASLGVPRVINVLCRTALAIAEAGGRATVSAEQIEAAIQACMLHAQESLAVQDIPPLPDTPAASPATTTAGGPGPPRPEARWPMVVDIETAANGVSPTGAPARRWPRKLLRSAPPLLAGVILGLVVVTLYPKRLEVPEAILPGLLLSADDDKARSLGAEPAPEPPVETWVPEAAPVVLEPEPPKGTPKIEPAPPGPPLGPPAEARAPEAAVVLEPEPPSGTPKIEPVPAGPAPEPPAEAQAPEAAVVLEPEPPSGTPKIEPEPAGPAPEPALGTRTPETAPSVSAPKPPAETLAPAAGPAELAPKPPVKPRLLRARGQPATAVPLPEAPDSPANAGGREPGQTSWLDKLADLVRSAEPPRQPRRLERQLDR